MNTEKLILSNLIFNEEYGRQVLPFLLDEYFSDRSEKITFNLINSYVSKYNVFPSKEALYIELQNNGELDEHLFKETNQLINLLETGEKNHKWLIDTTEKFCRDKALMNALYKSIKLYEEKDAVKGAIPQLLQEALSVSFDTKIGHDFIDDAENRFDYYHSNVNKIPFDLHYMNEATEGGLPAKTLTIYLGGVHAGKSSKLTHCAANNLRMGYNVLFISMEMSQEEIAKRIDANLLDINLSDLKLITKEIYMRKINKLNETSKGKVIIKEYPTSQAHTGHFRHLLNELSLKKNFAPDIIYVDYLNICASAKLKRGGTNSYEYIGEIGKELRGLAVEYKVPVVSAAQLNREGFRSSDFNMADIADSFGISAHADCIFGLIVTDELKEQNQILIKQLKNRLGDMNKNNRFVVGFDRQKMRFYDVDDSEQENILDGPVFENTNFGDEENERAKSKFRFK